MKATRILWLVVAFIVLFPLIMAFEIVWLIVCLRSAHILGMPKIEGVKLWLAYIKAGVDMNKDFVINGL